MPETMERVLVTGAAGFIGSHLSAALLRCGCRVTGIDNFDPFYDRACKQENIRRVQAVANRFNLVEADIRDAAAMQEIFAKTRPTAVFHIAALAGVRQSIADPARYASVNVDGLIAILDAARAAECGNIVFASSSSVYGNCTKVPFAETDPVDEPISPYAATKRAGELICHTYAKLFNLHIAALRFFTVYGPSQRPDLAISKFMRLIASDIDVPMFGDGSTSRDYTYIDDIIQGVLAAYRVLRSHSKPTHDDAGFFRIWNLGSDHPITLAEMIDAIATVVGKPARIKRLPMQPGDVERTWADVSRSAKELGYRPTTTFSQGLQMQWNSINTPVLA